MYRHFFNKMHDRLQAQEVVQDTFIYLSRRMPKFQYDRNVGSFKSWLRVVTRSRIKVYVRSEKRKHAHEQEATGFREVGDTDPIETWPDPAADVLDQVWQREWERNLLAVAFRRVRAKVTSRQLLIFRAATFGGLSITQVAKKLDVSVAKVYLARHRVGKLFRAEVRRLQKETE